MARRFKPKVTRPARPILSFLFSQSDAGAISDAIVAGQVGAGALRRLRAELHLTITEIAKLLGVSARTIVRKEQRRGRLSHSEADRAYRLARVADAATAAIGSQEKAATWLRTSSMYLGGKTPLQMLETEIGTELVLESLSAIEYGGVA